MQAARQAEIDRKEREQREADQRRHEEERAQREAEQQRRELGECVDALSALEIAQIVADNVGTEPGAIAARVLEIPREEWFQITNEEIAA